MTTSRRLPRLLALQHRLAMLRLTRAQSALDSADQRGRSLDEAMASLSVGPGAHAAVQLAMRSEMAGRLRGAYAATTAVIADAAARRDQCHAVVHKLDLQQKRLAESLVGRPPNEDAHGSAPRRRRSP